MNHRIVSSKEIAECPQHRLDPQHYLPEHKWEECDPQIKKRVKLFREVRQHLRDEVIKREKQKAKDDIHDFTVTQRKLMISVKRNSALYKKSLAEKKDTDT